MHFNMNQRNKMQQNILGGVNGFLYACGISPFFTMSEVNLENKNISLGKRNICMLNKGSVIL